MKYYTLGDLRDFKCIGSSCRHHCCKMWSITIDSKTEAYYKSVSGKFGEKLAASIIKSDGKTMFKLNENGICPFFNNEGLCDIYINLGPDKMCDTCKNYPRLFIPINQDIYLKQMTMSCSEVGRLWLSQTKPLELKEYNVGNSSKIDKSRLMNFKKIRTGFEISLSILQNKGLLMPERIQLIIYFNQLYEDYLKEEKDTKELINLFSGSDKLQFIKQNITPVKADSIKMHKWILSMCSFFIVNGKYIKSFFAPIIEKINETDSSEYPDMSELISPLYKEENESDFELFFAYLLYNNYFYSEKDFDIVNHLRLPIYLYYLQLSIMAYIRQSSDIPLNRDDFTLIYSLISRNLEHGFATIKEFSKLCEDVLGGEASDLLSITF